ncbi:MAG: dephospho-CoA kinase [Bacteroidaceae bacterium]|nr:dephospho-CoA kinase [Bacteroidaceae bacterium]
MMVRLGITGGIGSGKSYVCHCLSEDFGIPVYNCDLRARELMMTDDNIRKGIVALLGSDAYDAESGILNRKRVADFLFASSDNAKSIESLVHPVVRNDLQSWFAEQHVEIAAMESAILYESGFDTEVNYVVFVDAPLDVRIERIITRDKTTVEEATRRIASQHTDAARSRADYIVLNDGQTEIENQIKKIIQSLC